MKEITKTIYKCDFCDFEDERKELLQLHEECCAFNPKNQPCSTCSNMILGYGCSRGKDTESVGGNVLCFFYSKGTPQIPFNSLFQLNSTNMMEDTNSEDDKHDSDS